ARDASASPPSPTRRSSDLNRGFADELHPYRGVGHEESHRTARHHDRAEGGRRWPLQPVPDLGMQIALGLAPLAIEGISGGTQHQDRKSTRLNSSHQIISYA